MRFIMYVDISNEDMNKIKDDMFEKEFQDDTYYDVKDMSNGSILAQRVEDRVPEIKIRDWMCE